MPRTRRDSRLPPYVYRASHGYVWKPYRGPGVVRPTRTIAGLDANEAAVWRVWERLQENETRGTLRWLLDEFIASPKLAARAERTRAEYTRQAAAIVAVTRGEGQPFGDAKLSTLTPGVMTRYVEYRSAPHTRPDGSQARGAPVAANRELALISSAWNWALARDLTAVPNPCTLAEKSAETARQHYADDADYDAWIAWLRAPETGAPWYVPIVEEIAYLCRMRKIEVLTSTRGQALAEGFDTLRRKGSRDSVTTWTPRLRSVIDTALATGEGLGAATGPDSPLIVNTRGLPLTTSGFTSVRKRLMKRAAADGVVTAPFTTHDLKRKGASDSDEHATLSTGNSERMTRVYDVSKPRAKATR